MLKMLRYSATKLVLLAASVSCLYLIYSQLINVRENAVIRNERVLNMENSIYSADNMFLCKQPVLPVDSPEMMKFVKDVPKINCVTDPIADWVTCQRSECRVKDSVKINFDHVECTFRDVLRQDDHSLVDSPYSIRTDDIYRLVKSDVVKINCESSSDGKWTSVKTGIRYDPTILKRSDWTKVPSEGLKMNVLMFGLDSVSRNTFIRKLPRSYKYLIDELGALVLTGYNIVGDGTPQALTPILTGKTELELPDVRKRFAKTDFVDVYPFVWYEYRKYGYVTAFYEDLPETGIYTYRLNGFKDPPTDHYMRPYYLASEAFHSKWNKYCDGEVPRHQVMLNQIKDFYAVYKDKPKFLFGFHGELSHDNYNLVGVADDDIVNFLRDLNDSDALNNTILIVMADHGHRFADIRNTLQGKLEERLPFFSFRFPPWFKDVHQELYETFVSNLDSLTTPFDIHRTLKDILIMDSRDEEGVKRRAMSLFTKIPKSRTCADAYIEPHWCACLDWDELEPSDPVVPRLVAAFERTLNAYTSAWRDVCAELRVERVLNASRLKARDKLLRFEGTVDRDGFEPRLGAGARVLTDMYQVKVRVAPGGGIFEASITNPVATDKYSLSLDDVSRVNVYGRQARCIENDYPNLRKYCYCTTD